jgi:3-deoxy-manno-octulosonate cytidylyltransferase (CMP-KDO synthetase)
MSQSFKVVIPARYASTRLPGKPLRELLGKPMLQHVWEAAGQCSADQIVIATDDERIESAARAFGAEVCMTASTHASGTDRLGEVVSKLGWSDDTIVVNVQGDEPLMPPGLIDQVAGDLADNGDASLATVATPLVAAGEFFDPNVVKVVQDKAGYALYFSRAQIPWDRDLLMVKLLRFVVQLDGMTGLHPSRRFSKLIALDCPGRRRATALHHQRLL